MIWLVLISGLELFCPNEVVRPFALKLVSDGEGDRVIDFKAGAEESTPCKDSKSFECVFLLNRPRIFFI